MAREEAIMQVQEACSLSRNDAEALLEHCRDNPHQAITFFLDSDGTAWLAERRRRGGSHAAGAASRQSSQPGELQLLTSMGFPAQDVAKVLAQVSGNLDAALNILTKLGDQPSAEARPTQCSPCAASTSSSALPSGEQEDCPICTDTMDRRNGAAVARCDGRGGAHHYFHAQCLGDWIKECKGKGLTPNCPTCRGALEVNGGRLRREMRGATLPEQVRSTLEDLAEQVGDADCFREVDWKAVGIAAAFALGAMALIGIVGALASDRSSSSRARRQDDRR
mmetsp:Transcript_49566/g.105472  ORF Transcript_49566/g.105472 Transcript_49566/m.105472 type:complete len:279 (+) Transcript_49566:281-1117(+)